MIDAKSIKICIVFFLLGSMCGFVFNVGTSVSNFYLVSSFVSLSKVGVMSLTCLPCVFNIPIYHMVLKIRISFLEKVMNQKILMLISTQLLLSLLIFLLSKKVIMESLVLIAIIVTFIIVFNSIQENILADIRSSFRDDAIRNLISVTYVIAYRLGMIFSSTIAFLAYQYLSWGKIYQLMSKIVLLFPIITLIIHNKIFVNKSIVQKTKVMKISFKSNSFVKMLRDVVKNLGGKRVFLFLLLFAFFYRSSSNMINPMLDKFLLDKNFSVNSILFCGKILGQISSLLGSALAYYLFTSTVFKNLLCLGFVNAIFTFMYVIQEKMGCNICLLALTNILMGVVNGMMISVYMVFFTNVTVWHKSPMMYPILSSTMSLSKSVLPTMSGLLVVETSWNTFFIAMFIFAVLINIFTYKIYHLSNYITNTKVNF